MKNACMRSFKNEENRKNNKMEEIRNKNVKERK
jgi:hypothetical protein